VIVTTNPSMAMPWIEPPAFYHTRDRDVHNQSEGSTEKTRPSGLSDLAALSAAVRASASVGKIAAVLRGPKV